jgi:hypothetical protein
VLGAGVLDVVGGQLTLNAASRSGGALAVGDDAAADLSGTSLTANHAVQDGGAISTGGTTTLDAVTVADNVADRDGGGVFGLPDGGEQLVVRDSLVDGNAAGRSGGGLYLRGDYYADNNVLVERTTISANSSLFWGGGAFAYQGVTIDASTFSGNTGLYGGGVAFHARSQQLLRSTVSGNRTVDCTGWGAGVSNRDSVTIRSSTIVDNGDPACPAVGAVHGWGSSWVTVSGSVLANGSGLGPVCTNVLPASGGYNLVSDGSCGFAATGDLTSALPLLGPLADNGGPTPTLLPTAESPVLDAIPTGTPGLCDGTEAVDQRGVTRPAGSGCDIGSVERDVGP